MSHSSAGGESFVICESAYLTLMGIEKTGMLTNAPKPWKKIKQLVIEAKSKGQQIVIISHKIKNLASKPHKSRKSTHAEKFIKELANKGNTDPTYNVGVKEVCIICDCLIFNLIQSVTQHFILLLCCYISHKETDFAI